MRPVLASFSRFISALGLLLTGCSAADATSGDQSIVGGTTDPGDPGVVILVNQVPGSNGFGYCTGSLISPTVILTAGHCIVGVPSNAVSTVYTVNVLGSNFPASAAHAVSSRTAYPGYDPVTHVNDIGVVKLASPITNIPPLQYLDTALPSNIVGQDVRLVGFGTNKTGPDVAPPAEVKREVTTVTDGTTATLLQVGTPTQEPCFGDSGGPALLRVGGSEYVVGVFSTIDQSNCKVGGNYTRVDKYLTWLHTFVSTSGPTKLPAPTAPGTPTVENVTWGQLSAFVSTCNSANMAITPQCMSAYKRFCASLPGNDTGFGPIGKTATAAAVVCMHTYVNVAQFSAWDTPSAADYVGLTSCNGQSAAGIASAACATSVHRYCHEFLGQATGFGPVEHSGDSATIACLDSAQVQVRQSTYTELVTFQAGCNGTTERWGGECNAAIDRLCRSRGFVSGYGPVENSGDNVNIVCVNPVAQ